MNRNELSVLDRLHRRLSGASKGERDALVELTNIYVEVLESEVASEDLLKLERYLKRLLKVDDGSRITARQLFRYIVLDRPSRLRKLPDRDLKKIQVPFWRALEEHADMWEPRELDNLLAYSLGSEIKMKLPPAVSSKAVVKIYREFFKLIEPFERSARFEELLQRIMSEPQFRNAVAHSVRQW